jgi:hypothetical protein
MECLYQTTETPYIQERCGTLSRSDITMTSPLISGEVRMIRGKIKDLPRKEQRAIRDQRRGSYEMQQAFSM